VITHQKGDPMGTLDGTYGMESTTVGIDCYHNGKIGADAIAAAVFSFLKDYAGAAGAGQTVNAVIAEEPTYRKLFNSDGTDSRQRISSRSYFIQHTAS
jgi:hypothetical protein